MPREKDETKNRKVNTIINWLERPPDERDDGVVAAETKWYRECLSVARFRVFDAISGASLHIFTFNDLVKFFDAACSHMQLNGCSWDEALDATFPESRSDAEDDEPESPPSPLPPENHGSQQSQEVVYGPSHSPSNGVGGKPAADRASDPGHQGGHLPASAGK